MRAEDENDDEAGGYIPSSSSSSSSSSSDSSDSSGSESSSDSEGEGAAAVAPVRRLGWVAHRAPQRFIIST